MESAHILSDEGLKMLTVNPVQSLTLANLIRRRESLGMTFAVISQRSGVAEATVKRIFGGRLAEAAFANVLALSEALGLTLGATEVDAEEFRKQQARRKAIDIVRLVQGTSALEAQAIDAVEREKLVERTYHELLAGPARRLWG